MKIGVFKSSLRGAVGDVAIYAFSWIAALLSGARDNEMENPLFILNGYNNEKEGSSLKIIYVSAAILCDLQGRVLIIQRPLDKEMAGLWEFPGGKIEVSESPEQALQRELNEELGIDIHINDLKPFCFVSHLYPTFQLVMLVYQCSHWRGEIRLQEGQQNAEWVTPSQLKDFPMPPADLPIFDYLTS